MSLVPGTHLGPYADLSPLGAGGAGEVYRVRDTRLDRDVAPKVLPEHLSKDRAALARGALGVRRWLEIAEQVAQGLTAAHEKGIVHRDVKPENAFFTREGRSRVLDSGLARRTQAARSDRLWPGSGRANLRIVDRSRDLGDQVEGGRSELTARTMVGGPASKARFVPGLVVFVALLSVGHLACSKKKEFEVPAIGAAGFGPASPGPKRAGLAEGKPWRASSAAEGFAVSGTITASPEQDFFFHTREEESPWVELDLGSAQWIRSVTVVNRLDGCLERAIPVVVEVGMERSRLEEVGREASQFTVWSARFAPQRSRYVRVRADRKTFLHLSLVSVD